MSEPTFAPLNVGDVRDDDPEVMDRLYEGVANAPDAEHLPIAAGEIILPSEKPHVPGRLLTGYLLIDATWSPQQILTPDVDRASLHLKVRSPSSSATDFLVVADEPGKLGTPTGSGRLYAGDTLSLDGSTAGLWVAPFGTTVVGTNPYSASGPLALSWWAATKR